MDEYRIVISDEHTKDKMILLQGARVGFTLPNGKESHLDNATKNHLFISAVKIGGPNVDG